MRRINTRILVAFVLLAFLAVLLSYLTIFSGTVGLSWSDLSFGSVESRIFWDIRVPRLAAAVLSGISLAVA